MKKLILFAIGVLAVSGGANAQNYNAFKQLDGYHDITVTQVGDVFTVTLGANPTVTIHGKTEVVKDVTGFWLMGKNGGLNATLNELSGFQIKTNSGGGTNTAGWFTQNKNGLEAGQSITFTAKGFTAAALTDFGFMLHADGVPAHVKINKQPVPEPMSLAALGVGAVALLRKRKTS